MAQALKTIKPKKLGAEMPSREIYPSICIHSRDLPEIKEWKVGESYKLVLEVKQTSMREDRKNEIHADFDIKKIAAYDSYKSKDQKLKEKVRDLA